MSSTRVGSYPTGRTVKLSKKADLTPWTELELSEYVTRVTQSCDGQHEKTVLSHKGTARPAFNAVATNLTAVKNKKHIQWPISYTHNGILHTLAKGEGGWGKISANLMLCSRKIIKQNKTKKRFAKILRQLTAQPTFAKP